MGPRPRGRGDGTPSVCWPISLAQLQWVHGRAAVVMVSLPTSIPAQPQVLQWVHGRAAVVMAAEIVTKNGHGGLQWVHGPRTVVMGLTFFSGARTCQASMGPRSEDRGDGGRANRPRCRRPKLQWVHGPRTVVMAAPLPHTLSFV